MLGERKVGETRHKTPNLLRSLTWYGLDYIEKVKMYSLHSRKYTHASHCLIAITLLVFINFRVTIKVISFRVTYLLNISYSNTLFRHDLI